MGTLMQHKQLLDAITPCQHRKQKHVSTCFRYVVGVVSSSVVGLEAKNWCIETCASYCGQTEADRQGLLVASMKHRSCLSHGNISIFGHGAEVVAPSRLQRVETAVYLAS